MTSLQTPHYSTHRPNQSSEAEFSSERSLTPSPPPKFLQIPPPALPPHDHLTAGVTRSRTLPSSRRSFTERYELPEISHEPKTTRMQRIIKWAQKKGTPTETNVALTKKTIEVVDDPDGFVRIYYPHDRGTLLRKRRRDIIHQPTGIIPGPPKRQLDQPTVIIPSPDRGQPAQPVIIIPSPPLQQPDQRTVVVHRPARHQPQIIPSTPPAVIQVPRLRTLSQDAVPPDRSRSSRNSARKEPEKFRAEKASSSRDTGGQRQPPSRGSGSAKTESGSRSGTKEAEAVQMTTKTATQVLPPSHGFATVEKQKGSSWQSQVTVRPSEASSKHDSDASSFESSVASLKAPSGSHPPQALTFDSHSYPLPLPSLHSSSFGERQNHGSTQPIPIYIPVAPPATKRSKQHREAPPLSFMPSPPAGSELSLPLSSLSGIPSNFGYVHSAPTNSQPVSPPMSMMSMPSPPGMASPKGGALYRGYEESLMGSVRSGGSHSTAKSERRDGGYGQ
ncbi:hypothetical protein BKA70DRAFT_1566549 [Coprinopsis sp. MPI-PUGE-AT-0042]|nr:hypothetical protein BKA70DRAFT_1566549 [Coprinopsis sp. MPI-PUGE-AT-0042]